MSEEIISKTLETYYQIVFLYRLALTNRAQKFTSPNSPLGLSVILCSIHRDITQKSNLSSSFGLDFKSLMKFHVSSLADCVLFMNYRYNQFFKIELKNNYTSGTLILVSLLSQQRGSESRK